ncbi:MAG: hypothetical protein QOE11_2364 [Solirubrobacteraceae bacterium]|nr:hypothetical protein [Solirubrobacteraceae bacterium]
MATVLVAAVAITIARLVLRSEQHVYLDVLLTLVGGFLTGGAAVWAIHPDVRAGGRQRMKALRARASQVVWFFASLAVTANMLEAFGVKGAVFEAVRLAVSTLFMVFAVIAVGLWLRAHRRAHEHA